MEEAISIAGIDIDSVSVLINISLMLYECATNSPHTHLSYGRISIANTLERRKWWRR